LLQSTQHSSLYPCDELCRSQWRTLDDIWGFGLFCWGGLANDTSLSDPEYPYPFTSEDISNFRWTIGGACLNTNCNFYNIPFSTLERESPCHLM
jgi:hypothetical protein